MSVNCPYCGHALKLRGMRPGRFQPKCPGCARVFLLEISGGDAPRLHVAALSAATPEATAVPGTPEANSSDFSVVADAVAPAAPPAVPSEEEEPPPTLGGYQILRRIGRGGMGAVYLARQVSLDRLVALKVMNAEWAQKPNFLVRFTREAFAAAQLVHHNIVQVYDIGHDHGVHYFSMEYVQGQSLGELLRARGPMVSEEAAGYILQAARGLAFAHERGMVHRDIKPDNLLLNEQGVVKVADLGLVRTPGLEEAPAAPAQASGGVDPRRGAPEGSPGGSLAGLSNVTLAGQAMGTPSFMAPEQGRDATRIDHRADIYSLGCTLYALVTGRPVFQGNNALEILTQHACEPIVRPEAVVKGVPRALSDIIVKMLAKKPEDRYASMADVARALEEFLGLTDAVRQARAEQHLRTLEQAVKSFNNAGLSHLRAPILLAFFGGCALLAVLLMLLGAWRGAGAVVGLGLLTGLAHFVVHGLTQRTVLFSKARDLVLSSGWPDFAKVAAALLLLALLLWLLGLLWVWLLAALLAVALAVGFHYGVDRRISQVRAAALDRVEQLLRTLRLRGLSEEAIQEFVCTNAGAHWEEFFEALFGYEAKLAARTSFAAVTARRPRFAAWREPLLRWLDRYQRARQEARARRHLQAVEQANLVAQGVDAAQAREQAGQVADAMVAVAAEVRQEAPLAIPVAAPPAQAARDAPVALPVPRRAAPPRRVQITSIYEVAEAPARPRAGVSFRRASLVFEKLLNTVFGSEVRFVVAAFLLVVCLFWLHSRELLPGTSNLEEGWRWQQLWEQGQTAEPLDVPALPEVVRRALCSLSAGIAGAVLLLSAIWRSWKIGVLVLLGAAVMVVGPVSGWVPVVESLDPFLVWLLAGGALALLGFLFGRDT
jgi:serine/threonine protein kinase